MPEKLSQGPRIAYDASKTGAGLSRGPNRKKTMNAAPWSQTFPAPQATLDLDFANDRGFVRGVGQGRSMDAVTFTRASVGTFVNDQGLLNEATNNTPRFDWASTAVVANRNLLTFTDNLNSWNKTRLASVTENTAGTTDPNGTNTAAKVVEDSTSGGHGITLLGSFSYIAGQTFTTSVYAKAAERSVITVRIDGNNNNFGNGVYFDLSNGTISQNATGVTANITSLGDGWYRCSATATATATATNGGTAFYLADSTTGGVGLDTYLGDGTSGLYLWRPQTELGSSATTYQPIAQPTTNTPLTANPTCNGLLIEQSRTNRILWNRDATDAAWVKTDVTAAKDQTGIDGVASAASSLTATAANGTCIQTITLASGSRTGSVYLKRITGTGDIQVSLDGSTYSTVDLSDTEWRRIRLSGTVTNPTVGIRIVTSGDAVAMDYAQVEDGAFETTPILTTTATVTRSVDAASIANITPWYRFDQGTMIAEGVPRAINTGGSEFFFIGSGTGNYIGLSTNDVVSGRIRITANSVAQVSMQRGTLSAGQQTKIVGSYAFDNVNLATSRATGISQDNSASLPLNSNISWIGTWVAASNQVLNGTIKQIIYVPKQLSNESLTTLSQQTT